MSEKIAFVFPGQGSQSVGMLAEMASAFPQMLDTFAAASEVLGYDLWALAQEGPQEKLNLTETTQPLLLTCSVAIWRIWCDQGGAKPELFAGHSLGEYSALVCAGVIPFEATVDLVRQRGSFMQAAVPVGTGAMAAVLGLDDSVVIDICESLSSENNIVEAVNFNSPGQIVIAGHVAAVEDASAALKNSGAKRVAPLPVSAPFHTSLMKPTGEALANVMQSLEFLVPEIPVVHNVHAKPETNPDEIRKLMVTQTSSAVQWKQCIQYMVDQGIQKTVECGPGKVLSGLSRRIHKPMLVANLGTPSAFNELL